MRAKMCVTVSAKKARRLVCFGGKQYRFFKTAAHRKDRRAAKSHLKKGDFEKASQSGRLLSGHDIA